MSTFQQLMTLESSAPSEQSPDEPNGSRTFAFVQSLAFPPQLIAQSAQQQLPSPSPPPSAQVQSKAAQLEAALGEGPSAGVGANHYPSAQGQTRLPPILQVEKQQVTTSATQAASASRRRNEANFACPVPGCGSTFTRRFNLRGHLRSHTEERPFVCDWPGCNKGFARQHDCKRHQALHTNKSQSNICLGCNKTFSRLDALNRHLRSDGAADCRQTHEAMKAAAAAANAASASSQATPAPVFVQTPTTFQGLVQASPPGPSPT